MKRLFYCLDWVDPLDPSKYQDMYDVVHLDEKWFYITRDNERFLLLEDDEDDPYRSAAHKSHVRKVMFLCAMARPRFNNTTNSWFDGKLGMWPVGEWVPAQRKSARREAGVMEWKNKNMNRELYRTMLMDELIPALLLKWPRNLNRKIRIQQDGARAHIRDDDEEFAMALEEVGLNAEIYTQPTNSPDLNILDLGFFRAIQSANDKVSSGEEDLIKHVQLAFEQFPREKVNHTWLTFQSCLNEIIKDHGGNNYRIPHMNKQRLERIGELPTVLDVTDDLQQILTIESNEQTEEEDEQHYEQI
jgi:hypothetical protein